MDAEIVERRIVHQRWSTLSEVNLRLPNGAIEPRVIEEHGNAAAVLLYDAGRRCALLVRQPRAPVLNVGAEPLLEVVAGRLDGKSGEDTARAEALEEAGVAVTALEEVATLWTMPAVSTERIALFLGAYEEADRIAAGGGAAHENECIETVEIPLARLWEMATAGELADGKTFTLVQALRLRRPELFA